MCISRCSKYLVLLLAVLFLGGLNACSNLNAKESASGGSGSAVKADTFFTLPSLIINLSSGDAVYVKLRVSFELANVRDAKMVEARSAQLKDVVITALSGKTKADLDVAGGKDMLREQILELADSMFGRGTFKGVYLADFVMQ